MKDYIKIPLRLSGKTLLWLLAVALILVAIAEMAVIGAVAWIHSEGGQDWLRRQLASVAQESGYTVSFERISYRFPHRLAAVGLTISDAEGVIAEADDIAIGADFLPLAARHLFLDIEANTVTIHRLPAGGEGEATGDEGFTVPDFYFRAVSIDELVVERLELKEEVAGQDMILSPRLAIRVSFGEALGLEVKGAIRQTQLSYLPERFDFAGVLAPDYELRIGRLAMETPFYTLSVSGVAGLEGGALDLGFEGQGHNLERLAPELRGHVDFKGKLEGTIDNPLLKMEATPTFALLRENGVSAVKLLLRVSGPLESPDGAFTAQGQYQGRPAAIESEFYWRAPYLMLENINGSAPDLNLSGTLSVNTGTRFAEGTLTLEASNLGVYSQMAGVSVGGSGTATARLEPLKGTQAITIAASLQDLIYKNYFVSQIDLSATLPDLQTIWPAQASLDAKGLRVAERFSFETLHASASREDDSRYALTINGSGRAKGQTFTLDGGAIAAGLAQETVSLSSVALNLSAQGKALKLSGGVSPERADLRMETESFPLSVLPVTGMTDSIRNLSLSGYATLSGPPHNPAGRYRFDLTPAEVRGALFDLAVGGDYEGGILSAKITGSGTAIRNLGGEARLPLRLSLLPFEAHVPQDTELFGAFTLDADAGEMSVVLLPPGHSLTGDVRAKAMLSGTVDYPRFGGTASIENGTYIYDRYDLILNELNLQTEVTPEFIRIMRFSARDRDSGTMRGEGDFSLQNRQATRLALQVDNFHMVRGNLIDGLVSASLNLQGRAEDYLLDGTVKIGPLDITIPEQFQRDIPELNIVRRAEAGEAQEALLAQFALDMRTVVERAFVRGWGLDAELAGSLEMKGTLEHPELNGTLTSVRGRYEEFGRRFVVDHANLRFNGRSPPSPYLDIQASTPLEEVTAYVNLSGPLGEPALDFSSVPGLPEDEILARILFGRNMNSISPFQALQLKQTLDRFRGRGGGFDPLAQLRAATGLDEIRVEESAEGSANVGVGKYLSDKVYLELESGIGEGAGGANLEISISPNIKVESKIGQNAQTGAGVSWRWDY